MPKTLPMHNMAHRHRRAARKNQAVAIPQKKQYLILDSNHKPDLRGEFAGAKVSRIGQHHTVWLTDKTARFYLDSGSIEPVMKETPKAEPEQAASAMPKKSKENS